MELTPPNTVIQQSWKEYPDFADYLVELGFRRVVLGTASAKFKSKYSLVWQALQSSFHLISQLRQIRRMGIVVAFGHFASVIKLLARLHLIHYEKLFRFAFFVHSSAWFGIFRLLARLDTPEDHYLIFSRSEIELYENKLGIARTRLHYVPYGDWESAPPRPQLPAQLESLAGSYYFSGGYSERDYIGLINAFRNLPVPLVVVCSSLNTELDGISLPAHITILRDLPTGQFEACIRHAKAGIIALKRDTGAAGQSVLIRLMRNAKPVIASDFGAMRDYIDDGISGFLIQDVPRDLREVITRLENNPAMVSAMGKASYDKHLKCFSRPVVSGLTKRLLFPKDASPT